MIVFISFSVKFNFIGSKYFYLVTSIFCLERQFKYTLYLWCLLPQHPSKPITVHTVTKKFVKELVFTGHPPLKTPDMRAICLEQPYIKNSVLSSLLSTYGPDKGQDEGVIITSQPAPKHIGQCSNIIAKVTDNRPGSSPVMSPACHQDIWSGLCHQPQGTTQVS